jgi:hypothetical protein
VENNRTGTERERERERERGNVVVAVEISLVCKCAPLFDEYKKRGGWTERMIERVAGAQDESVESSLAADWSPAK